jgi:hypothetical protein
MKKLLLFFMLIVSAKMNAQSSFLNFEAHQADSGGIAAWCLSGHETTFLQDTYADSTGQECAQGGTRAYYNIGSSDRFLWGFDSLGNYIDYYGVRLTGSTGFPNFTNALQVRNIPFSKVKIYFDKITLGNDQEGNDWFTSRGTESRFYRDQHNAHYSIAVDGHYFVSGKMPTTEMMIDYVNSGNCKDDIIKAKSIYTNVDSGYYYNDTLARALGTAFLADVGNRGIAFDFATLTSAIRNQYKVIGFDRNHDCNPFYNPALYPIMDNIAWGAVYECNNGKILLSDYPFDNSLDSVALGSINCDNSDPALPSTNSGNWIHINDNGNRVLSVLDNQALGNIHCSYKITPSNPNNFNNGNIVNNIEYLGRKFVITATNNPVAPVRLRLYFGRWEWQYFLTKTPQNNPNYLSDLVVTKLCGYIGCDISLFETYGEFVPIIESGTFGDGFYVDIMTRSFGQFIIHSGNIGVYPPAPAPNGNLINCTIGLSTQLNANNAFTTTWNSSNTAVATVSQIGLAPNRTNVIAVSNGSSNINYEKVNNANGCKIPSIPVNYIVNAVVLPAITGSNRVCPGSTIQMSNSTHGGTWSSLNNRLSVNATGLVTGLNPNAGVQAVVKYLVQNGNNCTGFVTKNITVHPRPVLPSINYKPGTIIPRAPNPGSNFCNNRTFDVVGAPGNGIFISNNNNVMTVGFNIATGFYTVRTVGLGNATLTYNVNDANGCFSSRSINGNVVNCPAFRESQTNSSELALGNNNNFTMFPNPAKNIVNIKCETVIGNIQATITDLMGKKIKLQALSIGNNSIDITNLAKGFYLITVASETGSKTQKLIIE